MLKEKLDKFKEKFKPKEGENNKRKIENLVLFVIILIVTIVAINYIWNGDNNKSDTITNDASGKRLASEENIITLITCVENEPEYRRCIQGIEK